MITVLKETPITVNGRDYMEQLVHDDCVGFEDSCDKCYYRDWAGWIDCDASCCTVHGCGIFNSNYFILSDL